MLDLDDLVEAWLGPEEAANNKNRFTWDTYIFLANDTPREELLYILPRLHHTHKYDVLRRCRHEVWAELTKRADLFPLEEFDYSEDLATTHPHWSPQDLYKLGENLFCFDNNVRDGLLPSIMQWTPALHQNLSMRVKLGTIAFFMCAKRLGFKLPLDLRQRIIRSYVYADYLYMKSVHKYRKLSDKKLHETWKVKRDKYDPIASRYRKNSVNYKLAFLSQHKSSHQFMYSTVYFGDTSHIESNKRNVSPQMQIRNDYVLGDYDKVADGLGLGLIREGQVGKSRLFNGLFETRGWDLFLTTVGASNLDVKQINKYVEYTSDIDMDAERLGNFYHLHKFMVDLCHEQHNWWAYQKHAFRNLPDEVHPEDYDGLVQYAVERGAGWTLEWDYSREWYSSWCEWTPELHRNRRLFTLRFRAQVSALILAKDYPLRCVAVQIIRWMAHAIWVYDNEEEAGFVPDPQTKEQNLAYLKRFLKKVPPARTLATEINAQARELKKWIELYGAK